MPTPLQLAFKMVLGLATIVTSIGVKHHNMKSVSEHRKVAKDYLFLMHQDSQ